MKLRELLDEIDDPDEDQLDYEVTVEGDTEKGIDTFTAKSVRFDHNDHTVVIELD